MMLLDPSMMKEGYSKFVEREPDKITNGDTGVKYKPA